MRMRLLIQMLMQLMRLFKQMVIARLFYLVLVASTANTTLNFGAVQQILYRMMVMDISLHLLFHRLTCGRCNCCCNYDIKICIGTAKSIDKILLINPSSGYIGIPTVTVQALVCRLLHHFSRFCRYRYNYIWWFGYTRHQMLRLLPHHREEQMQLLKQ